MKSIVNVFVKLAILCTIALVFFPNNSVAQSTNPRNGEIYYYQDYSGKNEYIAIQFFDGAIKVVESNNGETLNEFKNRVNRVITSRSKIEKAEKLSKDGKVVFSDFDFDFGWSYYTFSQSYKELETLFNMGYESFGSKYKKIS